MRNLTRKKNPKENFKLKNTTVENNISLARFPNKKDTTHFLKIVNLKIRENNILKLNHEE